MPEGAKRTEHTAEGRRHPTPPPPSSSPTTAQGLRVIRNNLERLGLLPKRDVTSYIYDYVFVWETSTSDIYETSTVASEINSMSTEYSTITSTVFKDAKSTTTVESTIVVTSTQATTTTSESSSRDKATEPVTTMTSKQIIVITTFVGGVTNSGDSNGPVTETAVIDGGGASGLVVVSGITTSTSTSGTVPPSNNPEPSTQSKQNNLSTGAKAGIGAGAGAAGLALLGALIFFALGRRRRTTSMVSDHNSQGPMAPSTVSTWAPPPPAARYSHLDSREVSYTERAAALARSMETMRKPKSPPNNPSHQSLPSNFNPSSRGASPSTPSELMTGYESHEGRHEMGGMTENTGWYVGPTTVPDPQYHEMPASPQPGYVRHSSQRHAW